MDWHALVQFLAATLLLLATPGPVMAIVAHNTLRHGTAAGLLTAAGVELGDACLLGAMVAGLTLSADLLPAVFRWLSLAGALYLLWLAAEALLERQWVAQKPIVSRCRRPILDGLTIAFTNPARLLFYAAVFPQFTDQDHSTAEQMIVLSALFVCAALAFESGCALTVGCLRRPAGWTRTSRFAKLGSAAVYLLIAVIAAVRFVAASG